MVESIVSEEVRVKILGGIRDYYYGEPKDDVESELKKVNFSDDPLGSKDKEYYKIMQRSAIIRILFPKEVKFFTRFITGKYELIPFLDKEVVRLVIPSLDVRKWIFGSKFDFSLRTQTARRIDYYLKYKRCHPSYDVLLDENLENIVLKDEKVLGDKKKFFCGN